MKIVEGRKIAENILKKLKAEINYLKKEGKVLRLGCILIGNDSVAKNFIRRKEDFCRKVGIDFQLFSFSKNIRENRLIEEIKKIQKERLLTGLIVQLPLSRHLNQRKVLEVIKPELDVDCLTSENLGKLAAGIPYILPPTAAAIFHILKFYKVRLRGKHVVIVGQGNLVGKPLLTLFVQKKATVTSCNRYTKNLKNFTRQADILITGVGKAHLIGKEMVKRGAIVLDAGVSVVKGKIFGDVKFEEVKEKAGLISPVPGGIGPLMVVMLLKNALRLVKNFKK